MGAANVAKRDLKLLPAACTKHYKDATLNKSKWEAVDEHSMKKKLTKKADVDFVMNCMFFCVPHSRFSVGIFGPLNGSERDLCRV